MSRRSLWLLLIGGNLALVSGGVVLAAGVAGPVTGTSSGVELAQAHEQQSQHQQRPPHTEQPALEGQQHMMTRQAPMHQMPGMKSMGRGSDTAESRGHDMSPVDVGNAPAAGPEARGGQLLEPTIRDGVKEFELTTGVVRWNILPDVEVGAYAYNGQVPGPLIRVQPNDRVRMRVRNELPEATTVHWHGFVLPIGQDGVPELSQTPIPPGGEHVYEFRVESTPGTYFYHTHFSADRQQPLGLYGPLIIDDPAPQPQVASEYIIMLGEWTVVGSETYPAMQLEDVLPNYFTFNGKSYPATETLPAKVGDRILFRLIGSGQFIHPIHIHGGPFQIVATDGNPVPGVRG